MPGMENSLSQYAALAFDFDGTLIDSYPAITASVNHVRALHGQPPLSVEEVKAHVGRGPDYLLAHTIPGYQPDVDVARYREHHPSVMFQGTHLLPGAAELLAAARGAGKRVALCSNKPRIFSTKLLSSLGIVQFFDVVIGPEDAPHPKPAPDMLIAAVRRLELAASQVLYIGDMTVDIQTARAAGVAVWVVPTGSDTRATLEAAGPDRILSALQELTGCLTGSAREG
jgi:phosphoglycolate phosphatase